jgi:hypothetical protein
MVSAKARLATALALPSTPREEGGGTPLSSSEPGPGSSAVIFLASSTALLLVHRLVDLDELAVGQLPDDARLVAVQQLLPVLTLQAQAPAERGHSSVSLAG